MYTKKKMILSPFVRVLFIIKLLSASTMLLPHKLDRPFVRFQFVMMHNSLCSFFVSSNDIV